MDATNDVFTVEQKCREGHHRCSPVACRLTLLILLPERKYGRWPNTQAYYWRSQREGSVSKPLYKPLKKYKHKSTSAGMPRFSDCADSLRADFPFHQLLSSSSNHNRLKDWDLICRHSSPAWFGWQATSRAAVESRQTKQGGNFFEASEDSPLSRKAIIRN